MATKIIAWNTGSGNITLTYQGQGDGSISVVSDPNDGSVRSQTITIQTTKGSLITKNVTVSQAACPFPVGDVKNYSYTGSYQEVELPAGSYKLQCWGAQGGSNGTNSSYGITAKAGGKGGYSEGILTLSQKTTVRVYVGGQGSASAGGFNGGGSTNGTSQYNGNNEFGYSKMGGGGGATDIRLSDGALLSRMIVAGGGSGGAMCYKAVTTSSTATMDIWPTSASSWEQGNIDSNGQNTTSGGSLRGRTIGYIDISDATQLSISRKSIGGLYMSFFFVFYNSSKIYISQTGYMYNAPLPIPSGAKYLRIVARPDPDGGFSATTERCAAAGTLTKTYTTSTTTTYTNSQVGYVGGGTNGGGYSSTYQGKQNAAGSNGSFGNGGDVNTSGFRYCSGAGGGGWYGGGRYYSDSVFDGVKYSGGGSGFVNTYANRSYRPSGYTGLQLDSGETKAGNTSFPSTSGGNETGHAGNGYARITRIS